MKKLMMILTLFITFCAPIFAETFVVTEVIGQVKYETSNDVWTELKENDKVTSKTKINIAINSMLKLKGEDDKVYTLGYLYKASVDKAIEDFNNRKKQTNRRNANDKLVEVTITPDHIDEIEFGFIKRSGFDSIKELPAGKNVVRLLALSWGHTVIELTWTESSASIAYVEEGSFSANELEWDDDFYKKGITEKKIDKKNVHKILDLIKKIDFYNQPGYVYHTAYSQRDGTSWYIEANIDGKYKSISREEPKETFLKDLGEALYRLAR